MKLLLDTQVVIWFLRNAPELPASFRREILNSANELFVSSVSAAEIAIKIAVGKLDVGRTAAQAMLDIRSVLGAAELALQIDHAVRLESLPLYHRDPFDRMLIEAMTEGLTLASTDKQFAAYGVPMLAT